MSRWWTRRAMSLAAAVLVLAAAGCAAVPDRPARSTLGCARAVVARVPDGLTDKATHCMAAAMISRYCSRTEAALASIGKEVQDLFGRGDAEWADLRADRAGLRCAASASNDAGLGDCCLSATAR